MLRFLLVAFLVVNGFLFALQTSESSQKNRMLMDLDFIKKTFEYSYAPAEWKKELFGWDLHSQIETVAQSVNKNKRCDIKQFQKAIMNFCKSMRDYHVSISFTSTEYASLPFDIRFRNGKYIFTYKEKNETLPIEVGDELLTMDGKPVETVLAELQKELGEKNQAATDRALALEILTRRKGTLGHQVPQGSIALEVRKPGSDKVETYQVSWNYKPERILNPFKKDADETIKERDSRLFLEESLYQSSVIPYYEEMSEVFSDEGRPRDLLGSRKSIFSTLGKEEIGELDIENLTEERSSWIWNWLMGKRISEDAKKFFDADLIDLPSGKCAGFVRISTYSEEDPDRAMEAFLSCMQYFQDEADMLLIDQTNNPGGQLLYMYALASVLTDRPLETLKDRRLLTQQDILKAIDFIDFSQGIDLDKLNRYAEGSYLGFLKIKDLLQNKYDEAQFIISQWELGHLLTDPYPLSGIKILKPHPKVNFTKPIFILVNEMDFSCGDEFPAILQDNRRATIIGTPTAGAGGVVSRLSFTNLSGISQLSYTTTITQRIDGTFIENNGVTPDIFLDFKNELYDKDNGRADFRKIYDILDNMTQSPG